jgi:hypothetical protein
MMSYSRHVGILFPDNCHAPYQQNTTSLSWPLRIAHIASGPSESPGTLFVCGGYKVCTVQEKGPRRGDQPPAGTATILETRTTIGPRHCAGFGLIRSDRTYPIHGMRSGEGVCHTPSTLSFRAGIQEREVRIGGPALKMNALPPSRPGTAWTML